MVHWSFSPSPALIPLAVLLALALVIGCGFWGYSYDDAFITYRYADNLARGQGLTYNPGEDVLGTTAPGYAVALGLLARVTGSLGVGVPQWGTMGSLVALAVVSLVPLLMPPVAGARKGERPALPLVAGPLALSLQWNVELLGAETLAVLALVVAAALLALVWERPAAAGALSALAMLFRLDVGLAAASIGLVSWWRRKRFPVVFAVVGLVPLVCGLAWLHFRFGSFLPNSLAGKQAEYGVHAVGYTLAEWSWLRRTLPLHACITLLALAMAGAVDLVRRGQWRHPILLALGLWLFAHEVFYRLVRVPFAPWYHVGLVNGLLFLAAWGALAVAAGLVPRLLPARRGPSAVATMGCAALLLMPIGLASLGYLHAHWSQPPDPRYPIYAEVGRHLARLPGPGRVAVVEIGVVGYFSRRPILDLVGLVSPEALAARQSGRLPALVADLGPRFIVDVPLHRAAYPIIEGPELAARYRPIATFEDPRSGRGRIRLLERSPPGWPMAARR